MKLPENHFAITAQAHYLPELAPFYTAKFREDIEKHTSYDFKYWSDEFPAKMSSDKLIELIYQSINESSKSILNVRNVRRLDLSRKAIELSLSDDKMMLLKVFVYLNENQEDYQDGSNTALGEAIIVNIDASGERNLTETFVTNFRIALKEVHDISKTSMIRWIFNSDHGPRDRTFQIKKEWDIDRDYYPWIDTELRTYYKSFIDSKAQILVAFGPPGTGKTSFIRDMICEMNLNAFISYDLKVLTSDSTFVRYLTDDIFDAIIIEDADELLTSDRGEYNKIIAKILNISDGLIKLPRKKLIFSTNLPKVEDIDPAIIRPGRCFDVLEFRNLDKKEATVVCDKLKIDLPKKNSDKWSLADLFLEKEIKNSNDPFTTHHSEKFKKRSVGFI